MKPTVEELQQVIADAKEFIKDHEMIDSIDREELLIILNQPHSEPSRLPKEFDGKFKSYKMGKIFIETEATGDTPVLDVRGWGYLTGKGALGLSEESAMKIQDTFEEWVIEALNNARNKS